MSWTWSKQVTENEDYIIAADPQRPDQQDAWCVIFKKKYDRVVVRYNNIQVLERGTKLSFELQPMFYPEDIGDIDEQDFQDHAADVLGVIVKDMHEKKTMVYVNKETGKQIEY